MSVIKTDLPLADKDQEWSKGEAIKAVKSWASDDDGNIDFKKYRKAFFFVDDDNDGDDSGGEKQGDYKLPFATVVDGELKAVWHGVSAAMGAINGARGGVDLGDDEDEKKALYNQISAYYKKFDETPPEYEGKAMVKREIGEKIHIRMALEPESVKDLGDGMFEATVTTASVDRTNETILTEGLDPSTWEKTGMPVLYGHDYSALPIGKGLSFRQFKNKFTSKFQLAVKEYPFAATVAALIKGGYLNAVSIGGVVRQWSDDYTKIEKMEMVEFSVVPVPANAEALITSRSLHAIDKTEAEVAKEYHEFVDKAYQKTLKGLDTDELDRHIKSLKDLTAILEGAKSAKTSEKDISNDDEHVKLTIRKTAGKISQTGQEIIRITRKV